MALVVEDGTMVSGAESYCTTAYADTYHANRGNTAWDSLDDDVKEASLRKATDYMVGRYRAAWAGVKKSVSQSLDWPRDIVPVLDGPTNFTQYYENTIVPTEVKNACASLALRAATAALVPDQERAVLSEQVGPISTTYDPNSSRQTKYVEIDDMLSPYLKNRGRAVPLVRV
jgi:hypothetical protein